MSAHPARIASAAISCVLILLSLAVAVPSASAQTVLWTKLHGGGSFDGANDITETADGGYIITGFNSSVNPGETEAFYLLRTDSTGEEIWHRTFSGPFNVWGSEVVELPEGGFLAAGCYEVSPNRFDSFVTRADAAGNLLWTRFYDAGLGDDDRAHAICLTSDGGFIVAGQAWVPDPPFGSYDFYVFRCDAAGTRLWSRFYRWPGEDADVALSIAETAGGGFMVAGFTQSGDWDAYVVRTDATGALLWQRTYGGDWGDEAYGMCLTSDGGFALTGAFISNPFTDTDFGLIKCDAAGNVQWERTYVGESSDWGQQVWQTRDGGFLLAGHTSSFGVEIWDGWVIRTDPSGTLLWSQTFGGSGDDRAMAVQQTADGNAIVAGWIYSDVTSGDLAILKIEDGETVDVPGDPVLVGFTERPSLRISPSPFAGSARLELDRPAAGPVLFRIFDVLGREVRSFSTNESAGQAASVVWDGRDSDGQRVAPGTYIGSVSVEGVSVSRKMVLLPSER